MVQNNKQGTSTSGVKAWAAQSDPERMEAKRLEKMQAHSHSHRFAGDAAKPEQKPR